MSKILASLACNLDENVLLASLPLFEKEKVEAIEWSFDTLYNRRNIPDWFVELLEIFSSEKRLIGHGVYFSLFLAKWSVSQQHWLDHLEKISKHFHFDHISEHFGFMTGADFHKGAPMNIPFTKNTLEIGRDRLKRIYNACECPVGIENLAFAYSTDEVKRHGHFLEALIAPVNGFIILDLHNIFCQVKNFDVSPDEILESYPLDKVREIHISGGSWEMSSTLPEKEIRRDTHDGAVPEEVFQLLPTALTRCEHVRYVVLEQLGTGLETEQSRNTFQEDFKKMESLINVENKSRKDEQLNSFLPEDRFNLNDPIENEFLYLQQMELTQILETSANLTTAETELKNSLLAGSQWDIEHWSPHMVETAMNVARKWKDGFVASR